MDPVSWELIGSVAIKEGIKFLYAQAGALLKAYRSRRDGIKDTAGSADGPPSSLPSDAFAAPRTLGPADLAAVAEYESEIRELRRTLLDYADGVDEPDIHNGTLLSALHALRQVMQAVYKQPILFAGEPHTSTPTLDSSVIAQEVRGIVRGIVADEVHAGTLRSRLDVGTVAEGASAIGIEVRKVLK